MNQHDDDAFKERLNQLFGPPRQDRIAELTSEYWETYTGRWFETFADSPPHEFAPRDLLAISMLAVDAPPRFTIWLLEGEGASETAALLQKIPADVDIWSPEAEAVLSPDGELWALWSLLASGSWPEPIAGNGMGQTRLSKLLAVKRPRLVPIVDSVVEALLPRSANYWESFRYALSDSDLRGVIDEATRVGAPPQATLLRRLDAALWRMGTDAELSA